MIQGNVMEQFKFLSSHKMSFVLIFVTLLTAFVLFLSHQKTPVSEDMTEDRVQASPDTFIPNGYVLVPIAVSNFESLNALISQYAIVNLYAVNLGHQFSNASQISRHVKTVAQSIKLIRSPLNPERFAVLAPEAQAETLIRHQGEFFVTIQNPTVQKQVSVNKELKRKNRIEYLEEENSEDIK